MNNSDDIILDIIENVLKLNLTEIPKYNSNFVFTLSHEEELITKKELTLLKQYICIRSIYQVQKEWVQADDPQPQKIKWTYRLKAF